MAYTTASRGVLFFYMSPFFVTLGAHLFVPGERLGRLQAAGLAVAFAGIALVLVDGLRFPTWRELIGDAMVFAAAVLWGATTVVVESSGLARISPHRILLYQLVLSALILVPASWAIGEPGLFAPTPLVIGAFASQTGLVVPVSYLVWFWLMTRYPASKIAEFTFLTPLFGVAFGVALLGDPLTPAPAAAALLVSLGIYLVNRPAR